MDIKENIEVIDLINSYPKTICIRLLQLRKLIIEVATEIQSPNILEEDFRWGEPSYLTKNGSTIRIDHITSNSNKYAMFFNCKSNLVDTFSELYPDIFVYKNNRAIIFDTDHDIPINELKHCIQLALSYHKIKHLPLLGA